MSEFLNPRWLALGIILGPIIFIIIVGMLLDFFDLNVPAGNFPNGNGWIDVDTQKPNNDQIVIVKVDRASEAVVCEFSKGEYRSTEDGDIHKPSHWKPL